MKLKKAVVYKDYYKISHLQVELLQAHGDDADAVRHACQALLNLSTLQFLQRSMTKVRCCLFFCLAEALIGAN